MSAELPNTSVVSEFHSMAKVYGFRLATGWVHFTVSDSTGELHVQSDWGNWAYRWNTAGLGCADLTTFLSRYEAGDCYVVYKLMRDEERHRINTVRTYAALHAALESEVDAGNLDEDSAETLQADIEEWDDEDYAGPMPESLCEALTTDGLRDFPITEDTLAYRLMKDALLPLLYRACVQELAQREAA